jgi:hypothetical protein
VRDLGVACGSLVTCQGIEISNAIDVYLDHVAVSTLDGYSSWGLRLTNTQFVVGSTGGYGLIRVQDSVIRGGVKADRATIFTDVVLRDNIIEEARRGAFVFQPIGSSSGTMFDLLLDHTWMQDNFHFYALSEIYYTQPAGISNTVTIKNNISGLAGGGFPNLLVNQYFDGALNADAANLMANQLPATFSGGKLPQINRTGPLANDIELRGSGANLSPAIIPHATLAVPDPSTWSGSNCSVTTGATAPDGSTAAVAIAKTGGSTPFIGVLSDYSVTPTVGDYILYGGWVKNAVGSSVFAMSNSFQQQIVYDSSASTVYPADGGQIGDEWHPVVGLTQITTVPGGVTSRPQLQVQCAAAPTVAWPFMIHVSASEGISQQEIMRWRKQLLHGVVPPSMPASALAISPTHKIYFGSDTNVYRGAAGVVKTDGSFDAAVGFKCNGSFGTNNQVLSTTGSGCQWITPSTAALADPGGAGIVKRTTLNTTVDAVAADVVGLFGSGSCSGYLKSTGGCDSGTGSGLADPGANGIVKRTASNVTAAAAASDVVGLFGSGSCSGYLKSDYSCGSPGGTLNSATYFVPWSVGSSNISFVANKIIGYSFNLTEQLAVNAICKSASTADNTGNLYDIGISDTSGNLLAHTGAIAGTVFAPNTSTYCNAVTGGPITLQPGTYLIQLTTNCASACAVVQGGIGGGGGYFWTPIRSSAGWGSISGGALPSTSTPPSADFTSGAFTYVPFWFGLHN